MGYLQDLYEGDRMFTPRPDDRDLVELLRARGYAVAVVEQAVYGPQTDALLGTSWTIDGVARMEGDIMELKAHDSADDYGDGDYRRYTLDPIDHAAAQRAADEEAEASRVKYGDPDWEDHSDDIDF
jgi:hypothetical protein